MKKKNSNTFQKLTRTEMKEIMAGTLRGETATVLCNNGDFVTVPSCTEENMNTACAGKEGAKICSGGGNNPELTY